MKRPSFQFYPADWRNNTKLRMCSLAARGAWIDVMCLLHDSEEYGVFRHDLRTLSRVLGADLRILKQLISFDVLKGADGKFSGFVYTPIHARVKGEPVTLIPKCDGPCWYSSRMVVDEYLRGKRGDSTRFSGAPLEAPLGSPMGAIGARSGDGPTSSSSSTEQEHELPIGNSSPSAGAEGPPTKSDPIPYQAIVDAYNGTMAGLPKVRELTAKRRALIRGAWQASPQRRCIEFWRDAYFPECNDDPFTNGTGPYANGHEGWRPSFDYLLRADVVTRIYERALDRMERAA